jgi:hypothetical protein
MKEDIMLRDSSDLVPIRDGLKEHVRNELEAKRNRILYVIVLTLVMIAGGFNAYMALRSSMGEGGGALAETIAIFGAVGITVVACYLAPFRAGKLLRESRYDDGVVQRAGAFALIALCAILFTTIVVLRVYGEQHGYSFLGWDTEAEDGAVSLGMIMTVLLTSCMVTGFILELTRGYALAAAVDNEASVKANTEEVLIHG